MDKLLANGVEVVLESESVFPRGRSYSIQELLFVDYERVEELLAQHGDLETAPLLGSPWPTSQFLSHLLERVEQDPRTTFFAEYLNYTNLAYLLPGSDDNLDPLKYTAFVPSNNALAGMLYADAPDPFQLDVVLRDNLILNHLVQGRLYEDDLQDGLTLSNLANNTFTVSRNPDGTIQVDNATVIESQVFIYNLGIVYLIDGVVGITDQDVEAPPAPTTPSTTSSPSRPTWPPAPPPPRRPPDPSVPASHPPLPPPAIRFETRTEISISRRVNDGQAEPVPVSES
ncbi:putative periostin [Penaeus vannamei]|uniref:Putative periostin n=1 Tax=Penaeus vannamei TaxID=6689 RepID=A0A3R7QDN6_PENVA|nr:putative periostin [Penaeus vannamei]